MSFLPETLHLGIDVMIGSCIREIRMLNLVMIGNATYDTSRIITKCTLEAISNLQALNWRTSCSWSHLINLGGLCQLEA